jgi:RNA polymerase sigma-70 factor (ECF subfamily)
MTGNPSTLDLQGLLADDGFLRRIARGLLFDEHAVDDAVQEAWLRAIERPPRDPAAARGWLASVVRNVARNERRGSARRRAREQAQASAESVPSTADVLAREATRKTVLDAVLALSEPYRGTVLLRFYEGLAPAAIARRAGLPAATVRTRLKRALEQLRARLDAAHGGDRRAWGLALVPLARPQSAAAGLLASFGAAAAGVLLMKKVWMLGALLAIALLAVVVSIPPAAPPQVQAPAAAPALAAAQPEQGAAPAAAIERVARDSARDALATDDYAGALAGFRGRLVDAAGAPLADEPVRVFGADAPSLFAGLGAGGEAGLHIDEHRARSGGDGRFLVEGVWPRGRYLLLAGDDGAQASFEVLQRSPGPGEIVELGDVVVARGGVITGTVVGDDGAPLAGAQVWSADVSAALLLAVPLDRFHADGALLLRAPTVTQAADGRALDVEDLALHWLIQRGLDADAATPGPQWIVCEVPPWLRRLQHALPVARARTDADGRFELRGVAPGGNALIVQARGWRNGGKARVLVHADRPRDVGTIRMQRGDVFAGRVRDARGAPVAGAEVALAPAEGLAVQGVLCTLPIARADRDGRFAVPGVVAGGVVAAVRARAGDAWHVVGPLPSSEPADVDLPAGVTCTFVLEGVRDDVELTLTPGPALGELFAVGMQRPLVLEGRSERLAPDRVRVRDLAPGVYTVQVRAAGCARHDELVRIERDGEHALRLAAAAPCIVEVVDGAGRPVPGASVGAIPQPPSATLLSRIPSGSSLEHWEVLPAFTGRTDRAGRVAVDDFAAGELLLVCAHPGLGDASVRVRLPQARVRIELPACGAIAGQLFDQGEPALAGKWRIVAQRVDQGARPAGARSALPGAEGRFALAGLAPGEYALTAEPALGSVRSLGAILEHVRKVDYTWGIASGNSLRVTVRAGDTASARFDADTTRAAPGTAGAAVRGEATIDGQPAAGFEVTHGQGGDRIAVVDAAGRFRADALAAGVLPLVLRDPHSGATWWRELVALAPGEERTFAVHLQTGTIAGVVVHGDGRPLPGCAVIAESAGTAESARIETASDAAGRYRLRVPAGDYRVRADHERLAEARSETVAVAAGGSADAGTLTLVALARFAGRVLFDGVQPPQVAIVLLGMGGSVHFKRLAEDGAFDLRGLDPGEYTIELIGPGYERAALPGRVKIGAPLVDQIVRPGEPKR